MAWMKLHDIDMEADSWWTKKRTHITNVHTLITSLIIYTSSWNTHEFVTHTHTHSFLAAPRVPHLRRLFLCRHVGWTNHLRLGRLSQWRWCWSLPRRLFSCGIGKSCRLWRWRSYILRESRVDGRNEKVVPIHPTGNGEIKTVTFNPPPSCSAIRSRVGGGGEGKAGTVESLGCTEI